MIKELPPQGSQSTQAGQSNRVDVPAYLNNYEVSCTVKETAHGTIYQLDHCLFDPSHVKNESSIIQMADGKLIYQCFHNSCRDRTWREAREQISGSARMNPFIPGYKQASTHHAQLEQNPSDNKWPEIIPFGSEIVQAADVPLEAFPEPMNEMIQAVSECTGQDKNVISATSLGVLAAAARGRYTVELPAHSEHVTLYTMGALESGSMKDDILRFLKEPIDTWVADKKESERPGIAESKTRVAYLDRRYKQLIEEANGKRSTGQKEEPFSDSDRDLKLKEASETMLEREEEEKKIYGTRITFDNATMETIPRFLQKHGTGAVLSSEGRGFWSIVLGRYSDGMIDPDVLNKSYDAQPYDFDRTKESFALKHPSLSITQIVQNDLVSEVIANDRLRDCGLVHRFLFVFGKASVPLSYDPERRPSQRLISEYEQTTLRMIDRAEQSQVGTILTLSPEAMEAWRPFYDQVMKETGPSGGLSGMIASWARKHPGRAIRLAALSHLFRGMGSDLPIGKEDMLSSISIMTPLITHALRAYEGASDHSPDVIQARNIIQWVKYEKRKTFTIYETGREVKPQIRTSSEREKAVKILIERGMIRPITGESPAEKRFEVNPAILEDTKNA